MALKRSKMTSKKKCRNHVVNRQSPEKVEDHFRSRRSNHREKFSKRIEQCDFGFVSMLRSEGLRIVLILSIEM